MRRLHRATCVPLLAFKQCCPASCTQHGFSEAVHGVRSKRRNRGPLACGMTLFEVLLTLSLAAVILGLLGMAIDIHLRVADASRTGVAEAKTARMVLDRISDDLRNAIPISEDSSSPANPTGNEGETNVIPAGAASKGGLNGTSDTLQVAISRMPPFTAEQATATGEASASIAPVSDVRSVLYRLVQSDDAETLSAGGLPLRGLPRGEWERAVYAWAVQQGKSDELKTAIKVLSPDVAAVEFTYYDASTSYTEWDSTEKGTLPIAIRVAISLRTPAKGGRKIVATQGAGESSESRVYEKLVFLQNSHSVSELSATTAATTSSSN